MSITVRELLEKEIIKELNGRETAMGYHAKVKVDEYDHEEGGSYESMNIELIKGEAKNIVYIEFNNSIEELVAETLTRLKWAVRREEERKLIEKHLGKFEE